MSVSAPSTNANGQSITGTSGTTISNNSETSLGANQFLNLMMDQLENQDPTNPTDPTQYLSELAQFTMVEQQTNSAQAATQSASAQAVSGAVALIGHSVQYLDTTSDTTVSGSVQSVQITSSGPTLTVGGVAGIAPSSVTQVS